MLPRNFFTTYLNAFHASSSISVIVSVKLSSVISLRICGPSNIPSLILACDSEVNLVHKYWKRGLFLSNTLTNCFIIPSLMCKGGSRICSRPTRLTFETFLDPGCSCFLSGQCTDSQSLSLALLSHSNRKRTFCVASLLSQQQSNDLQITAYLPLMLLVFNFFKHQL